MAEVGVIFRLGATRGDGPVSGGRAEQLGESHENPRNCRRRLPAALLGAGASCYPSLPARAALLHAEDRLVDGAALTFTKTISASQDANVNAAGKTVGFDMIYFSAAWATAAAVNVPWTPAAASCTERPPPTSKRHDQQRQGDRRHQRVQGSHRNDQAKNLNSRAPHGCHHHLQLIVTAEPDSGVYRRARYRFARYRLSCERKGVDIVDGATVPVAVISSRTEAELIVGMLRSNGLRAAVSADDAGGQDPQLQVQVFAFWLPPPMKPRLASS